MKSEAPSVIGTGGSLGLHPIPAAVRLGSSSPCQCSMTLQSTGEFFPESERSHSSPISFPEQQTMG
jgi:hypothetical protein